MEVWVLHKDGKVLEQTLIEDGEEPRWCCDPKGAAVVRMDRLGCLTSERFDPDTTSWVPNPDYEEFALNLETGPVAIAEARLMKAIEARLILSGLSVEGILSAEAAMRGSTVEELAATVLEKRQEFIDNEINRQKASLKEQSNV